MKEVEPADIVLLRGEVPLEIDSEHRLHTPAQEQTPVVAPIPETTVIARKEEEEDFNVVIPQQVTSGFVAFSGKGYRLGGP